MLIVDEGRASHVAAVSPEGRLRPPLFSSDRMWDRRRLQGVVGGIEGDDHVARFSGRRPPTSKSPPLVHDDAGGVAVHRDDAGVCTGVEASCVPNANMIGGRHRWDRSGRVEEIVVAGAGRIGADQAIFGPPSPSVVSRPKKKAPLARATWRCHRCRRTCSRWRNSCGSGQPLGRRSSPGTVGNEGGVERGAAHSRRSVRFDCWRSQRDHDLRLLHRLTALPGGADMRTAATRRGRRR